jgi:hypothetical protein
VDWQGTVAFGKAGKAKCEIIKEWLTLKGKSVLAQVAYPQLSVADRKGVRHVNRVRLVTGWKIDG